MTRYTSIVVFIIVAVLAAGTTAHAAGIAATSVDISDADNSASTRVDCQDCTGDSQTDQVCHAFCLMQLVLADTAAVKLPMTAYTDTAVLSLAIHSRTTEPDPDPPRVPILI